jgi:hypothetical protein
MKRRDMARSRFWLGAYVAILLCGALPLLLVWHRWELLTVGGLAALVFGAHALLQLIPARKRLDRSQPGEVVSVFGLTLTAPAAFVVANGAFDGFAVCAWVICALYYAGGILNVKMNLTAVRLKRPLTSSDRFRIGGVNLLFHFGLAVMAIWFLMMDRTPEALLLLLAYAPAVARSVWDTAHLSHRLPPMKKLGWREAAMSVWFVGCTIGALLPPR